MTLDEAVTEFEALFPRVKDGLATPFCETGARYIAICSGGVKEEGELTPDFAGTEEGAIILWLDAAKKYAADKSGTLYWRERPDLASWNLLSDCSAIYGARGQWVLEPVPVYSVRGRFVIDDGEKKFDVNSDKPIERLAP